MNKKILVINAGSSSIKFRVYNFEDLKELANGLCERIFVDGHIKTKTTEGKVIEKDAAMPDHTAAVQIALDALKELKVIEDEFEKNKIEPTAARKEPIMKVTEITLLILIPMSWLVSKSFATALIAIPIFVLLTRIESRITRIITSTGVTTVTTLVGAPKI